MSLFRVHRIHLSPSLNVWVAFAGLIVIMAVIGCTGPKMPTEIRVGVVPDLEPALLEARFQPIVDRIAASTGIPTKLVIPSDYEDLLFQFESGAIELAHFGGLTFVQAQNSVGAIPLVMRDVDTSFTSYFIARADFPAVSLREFRGARLAFGSPISTSGHLMPRYFLNQLGIIPEDFFLEIFYSGAHDSTLELIQSGEADIGAINSQIYDQLVSDGIADSTRIQILMRTPDYPDYVWAVPKDLPKKLRHVISETFLAFSYVKPKDRAILRVLGAHGFVPVLSQAFHNLHQAITLLDSAGGN